MSDNQKYNVITPPITELQPSNTNVKAASPSQGQVKNYLQYACPSQGCPRNVESPRQQFFNTLYSLRMHFWSSHCEKKYHCEICLRKFSNEVFFNTHKKTCRGGGHECMCGSVYKSRNALLTHARRKQHQVKEYKQNDKQTRTQTQAKASSGVLLPRFTLEGNSVVSKNCNNILKAYTEPQKVNIPRLIRILPKIETSSQDVHKSNPSQTTQIKEKTHGDQRSSTNKSLIMKNSQTKNVIPGEERITFKLKPSVKSSISTKSVVSSNLKRIQNTKSISQDFETWNSFDSLNLSDESSQKSALSNEISTQTSFQEGLSEKRLNMSVETQVSPNNIQRSLLKATMDMHTQINFEDFKEYSKKLTTDTHTQIDSRDFLNVPDTLNIDTQTNINSYNFNDILKRMTMDTQTEIDSNDFLAPLKSTMESMDTQTDMNLFNFDGTALKNINNSGLQTSCGRQAALMENLEENDIHQEKRISMLDQNLNTNIFGPDESFIAETTFEFSASTEMETQTEFTVPWCIDEVSNLNLSTMSTQTNEFICDDTVDKLLLMDKSIQMDTISLEERSNSILTEWSNNSTQTVDQNTDVWLNPSFLCESSATQTDFFQDFDFMDIDFHIDDDEKFDSKVMHLYKDSLISGNLVSDRKSHMETQTTIPLLDLLCSPLDDECPKLKSINDIQTQTDTLQENTNFKPSSHRLNRTDLF